MRLALLLLALMMTHSSVAGPKLASLNGCYDDWLSELVPASWTVYSTRDHGNRLETLMALQPDYIVAGSFTDARLLGQLAKLSALHVITQPNDYRQWQSEVRDLGEFLGLSTNVQAWLAAQQQALEQLTRGTSRVIIVMPNYYTWAHDSWAGQLLQHFSVTLVSPVERGYLGQLRLEQLLGLSADRVVFEGFSSSYSRGQDWLFHPAVQAWLADKELAHVSATVASCPAVQALSYMQQLLGREE